MKWRTIKELPGIPEGTEAEEVGGKVFFKCLEGGDDWRFDSADMTNYPDWFERVVDEPEFVDAEIFTRKGCLCCIVPEWVEVAGFVEISIPFNIVEIAAMPEFAGFVYERGDLGVHPRRFDSDDNATIIPTHARFRRPK